MSSTIKIKRSAVEGKTPTTGQLELGEIALNTYDGKLYFKKSVNAVETIVALQESTSNTLTIDSSGFTNSSANNIAAVLDDLDTAINNILANVLTKDNSTYYAPTAAYHPATKAYVDAQVAQSTQVDDTVYSAVTNSTNTRILSTAPITKTIRYYVQAVHEDGYVYASEINILYDNNDIYVSEHSIINTYGADLINFSAILLGNEITLTATPKVSDQITIRFIRNILEDFPEIGLTEDTAATAISSVPFSGTNFVHYEVVAQNTSNDDLEKVNIVLLTDGTDLYETGKNIIRSSVDPVSSYSVAVNSGYINLLATSPDSNQRVYRVARIHSATAWEETTTTSTSQTTIESESSSSYRTLFFTVRVSDTTASEYQQIELLVTHDGTDVYMVETSNIYTNDNLATFTADINSGNIRLLATPASTNSTLFQVTRKILDL